MNRLETYRKARLETCHKFYLQYEGQKHSQIERDMRAAGFPDFNRRALYARGDKPGWVEKYDWDRELLLRVPASAGLRIGKPPKGGTLNLQKKRMPGQNHLRERAASTRRIVQRRK
jgi:hypothetical protein